MTQKIKIEPRLW